MIGSRHCLLCGIEVLPEEERDGEAVVLVTVEVRDVEGQTAEVRGDAHEGCGRRLLVRLIGPGNGLIEDEGPD